jgi:pimeloyl-ACP methyl ester carboxylesterase
MPRTLEIPLLLILVFAAATCGDDTAPEAVNRWRPLPGETFGVAGRPAFLIRPAKPADDNPWVLYAPTFNGSLPAETSEGWLFEQFLTSGIAIAGVDVGESYGSPEGRAAFTALYDRLTMSPGLSRKVCLLARSRGGLMVYNWAADNPGQVACIAGIYPVLDLTTYPGLAKACGAYKLDETQLRDKIIEHNPVERLGPLAKAKVPIFHIHGDRDIVVPYRQNAAEPARRYKALGGDMHVLLAKDQGHSHWPGFFHCQELVDFVVENAGARISHEE